MATDRFHSWGVWTGNFWPLYLYPNQIHLINKPERLLHLMLHIYYTCASFFVQHTLLFSFIFVFFLYFTGLVCIMTRLGKHLKHVCSVATCPPVLKWRAKGHQLTRQYLFFDTVIKACTENSQKLGREEGFVYEWWCCRQTNQNPYSI